MYILDAKNGQTSEAQKEKTEKTVAWYIANNSYVDVFSQQKLKQIQSK